MSLYLYAVVDEEPSSLEEPLRLVRCGDLLIAVGEEALRSHFVHRMAAGYPLSKENAFLPELELDRRPGYQPQTLPNFDRYRDLALGSDGASHG